MNEQTIKKIARIGLGANLVFAGISHLTIARKAFRAQVPNWVPLKKTTPLFIGVLQRLC